MIGTFSKHWVEPMAQVLKNLGSESIWVVHGSDGLDEITTSGPTSVAALENGKVRTFEITPEDAGLKRVKPDALRGGDAEHNAKALLDVLKGKPGPFRDVAILNAAAALIVAGKAKDLKDGAALAAKSIDSGEAEGRLDRLIAVSNAVEARDRWPIILAKIEAYKREEIAAAKRARPLAALEAGAKPAPPPRGFLRAIERKIAGGDVRADRRDQEGEPVEGPDPRRFRPAAACQGL